WVLGNRERLLRHIAHIAVAQNRPEKLNFDLFEAFRIFIPEKFNRAFRPVFTTFLVVVVSVVGWTASVGASYNSLPGDTLYGVKLATERTQVAVASLTGGPEKKAEALNNVAKTRAYEAKELVSQNRLDHVGKTLSSLQKTVEKASESMQDVKENDPGKATTVANSITETAESISQTLDEAMDKVDNSEIIGKISETKQDVTGKGIEAVGLVVDLAQEQKENGEQGGITQEKVEELVKKTIDNLSNHAEKAVAAAKEMGLVLEDSKQRTASATTTVSSTLAVSTTATSSLAAPKDDKIVTGGNLDKNGESAAIAKAANDAVTVDLETAKKLVQGGQLSEALAKAKEINSGASAITKDAKQTMADEKNKQFDLLDVNTGTTTLGN
ncbi:MAG: DUF5667 domain-containing protein, partial [Patescibacteria group bacterium]